MSSLDDINREEMRERKTIEEAKAQREWEIQDLVDKEVQQQLVRNEARKQVREMDHPFEPPLSMDFKQFVSQPLPEIQWIVKGLIDHGDNTLLSGKYKIGKSTLMINLLQSLVDGEPFLGKYPVQLEGTVCYMNYELEASKAQLWIGDADVRRKSRGRILNLRGKMKSDPLASEEGREWFVTHMQEWGVSVIVIDTFRVAYRGNPNDNAEAAEFTRMIDDVKARADVPNLILVNHFGRKDHEAGEEHGLGATELDNWADARWVFTRKGEDRFLMVEGRLEGLEESLLTYDRLRKRYTLEDAGVGVGKTQIDNLSTEQQLLRLIGATPGITTRQLREDFVGRVQKVAPAIKLLNATGVIRIEDGPKNAKLHYIKDAQAGSVIV